MSTAHTASHQLQVPADNTNSTQDGTSPLNIGLRSPQTVFPFFNLGILIKRDRRFDIPPRSKLISSYFRSRLAPVRSAEQGVAPITSFAAQTSGLLSYPSDVLPRATVLCNTPLPFPARRGEIATPKGSARSRAEPAYVKNSRLLKSRDAWLQEYLENIP